MPRASDVTLDHTGSYRYSLVVEVNCNPERAFQSFVINKTTGLLKYLGDTNPNTFTLGPPLTIVSNNKFACAACGNGKVEACPLSP